VNQTYSFSESHALIFWNFKNPTAKKTEWPQNTNFSWDYGNFV